MSTEPDYLNRLFLSNNNKICVGLCVCAKLKLEQSRNFFSGGRVYTMYIIGLELFMRTVP